MKTIRLFVQGFLLTGLLCVAQGIMAQELTEPSMSAQAAQMTLEDQLPTQESQPEAQPPSQVTSTPQLAVPPHASPKQARQIAKANEALAKQHTETHEPTRLQKATAKLIAKKMQKQMHKAAARQATVFDGTENQSSLAAQALSTLTLVGIILMGAGLLFLFIIPIVGLLFFMGGLICLILGLVNE